ncbi:uncharacterized protein [Nicotiana tomentosiformis]|uniref:uncharacterized protein n=1 Tax=Nicotiana tomentosiformis TaxID=4098 RepID=UPI00388CB987
MKQFQPQQPIQSGIEDLMKAFILKTDERLETHSAAIREHEAAIKEIEKNPKETVNAVTLRSGQVFKDPTPIQKDVIIAKESGEQLKSDDDKKKKGPMKTKKKKKEEKAKREEHEESRHMPALPFPQNLYREKLDKQFGIFIDVIKQVHVNLPFTKVLSQMPTYAKIMKEILTKKRKIEETSVVKLTEHCSAILQNKLPQKCGDPGSFIIPSSLGTINFDKSLCDSGASINLMPLFIYKKLEKEIGEIRSVPISL